MAARREGWLDQTGLNLIRGMIGSYFCAVALGVSVGFDPFVVLDLFLPSSVAHGVGSALLLILAVVFILGFMLRAVTLVLSGYLIASGVASLVLQEEGLGFGAVWQSVSFAAALLLCYGALKPYEMHKAALFPTLAMRGGAARVLQKGVAPRRVRPVRRLSSEERKDASVRSLRPLIAPTDRMTGLSDAKPDGVAGQGAVRPRARASDDDEVENIFANF